MRAQFRLLILANIVYRSSTLQIIDNYVLAFSNQLYRCNSCQLSERHEFVTVR